MMYDRSFRRLLRKSLYAFFAVGTVLLAGSLSPERLTEPVKAERPAVREVLEMTRELPRDRQAAWEKAADRDALTLFRVTCTGR